jgi:hypothetical protein
MTGDAGVDFSDDEGMFFDFFAFEGSQLLELTFLFSLRLPSATA